MSNYGTCTVQVVSQCDEYCISDELLMVYEVVYEVAIFTAVATAKETVDLRDHQIPHLKIRNMMKFTFVTVINNPATRAESPEPVRAGPVRAEPVKAGPVKTSPEVLDQNELPASLKLLTQTKAAELTGKI